MKRVRAILMAVLLVVVGAMGPAVALAQKGGGNDNRPPKGNDKIVDKGKEKPPPSNSNRGKPNE